MKNDKRLKNILFILLLVIVYCQLAEATIRYVSKAGLSIPPYTSWETAADSIQECINICVFGDTIYVANGVYEEQVVMIRGLSLIGTSNDSTIIDTRSLATPSSFYAVTVRDSCIFKNFRVIVSNFYSSTEVWWGFGIYIVDNELPDYNVLIENNLVENANTGIMSSNSNSLIQLNTIINSNRGIRLGAVINEIYPKVINNLVIVYNLCIALTFGSTPYIENNICISLDGYETGGGFGGSYSGLNEIYNNLFLIEEGSGLANSEEAYVLNNILSGNLNRAIQTANGNVIKNNIVENSDEVITATVPVSPIIKYNDIWNTGNIFINVPPPDSTNLLVDPMFINDTSDFHLQNYSPLIDKGDPSILDIDSTRSDIGLYGGPLGESYIYLDLSPRPPVNLTAQVDSSIITLKWNKNTEADLNHYNLFRDTVKNFTIDSTKLVASIVDTFYLFLIPQEVESLYFKLTAVDNQGNESNPSEEIEIIITAMNDYPMTINDYRLYQNYPNPFNPSTKIGYRLRDRGYVKLYVYDIKGELVSVLVNQTQEAGYYEVEFFAGERSQRPEVSGHSGLSGIRALASGVYIYQIMVRNDRDLPIFSDIKKMLMIK